MSTPLYQLLPELDMQEMGFIQGLTKNYSEQQLINFANMYRIRRRDPQIILLTALAGFLGVAGIHRFMLNQIGMGVLYLLTGGLCLIGTIVDLVNHRQLALEYNVQVANELSRLINQMPA